MRRRRHCLRLVTWGIMDRQWPKSDRDEESILIKQILLTALVTLAVVLIVQARRRAGKVSNDAAPERGVSAQAIAGWALLAVMLAAAIGAAFLQNG